jgi:membrane fusion protein (multidrug efflux system)
VLAPFAGTISDRWISPGEWVSPGMRLVTLVDADPLKVELTVPESEVPKIARDQPVEVTAVAWADKTFTAKITRMGAEIGRQTRALIVEATIDPGTPLMPGMFVQAAITTTRNPQVAIPETAVIHKNRTDRVYAVVNGHVAERVVQKGPAPAPGMVSVLKGLAEGDQVVVAAADKQVVDGVRVAASAAAPTAASAAKK